MWFMQLLCVCWFVFFLFKQKTADEMRISDWSSDVCSSDLDAAMEKVAPALRQEPRGGVFVRAAVLPARGDGQHAVADGRVVDAVGVSLQFVVEIGRASCRERVCQYV